MPMSPHHHSLTNVCQTLHMEQGALMAHSIEYKYFQLPVLEAVLSLFLSFHNSTSSLSVCTSHILSF